MTIIDPGIVEDEVNSLVEIGELAGRGYPRWEILGQYTGAMVGDPAISVIVDAYKKGIRGFDVEKAYALGKVSTGSADTIRDGWQAVASD